MNARSRIATAAALAAGIVSLPGALTPLEAQHVRREARVLDLSRATRPSPFAAMLPPPPSLGSPGWEGGGAEIVISDDEESGAGLNGEQIVELVSLLVAPASWHNQRNRIEVDAGSLLVVQVPEVIERVERFVDRLGEWAARDVEIEVALVPLAALREADARALAPGASPWRARDLLERALAAAGDAGVLLATRSAPGGRAGLMPRRAALRLADFAVNQTGVIPVLNPVMAVDRSGPYLEARALPSPGGRWFRLDVRAGRREGARAAKPRALPLGDLDTLELRQAEISSCAVVPAGRTTLLGFTSALRDAKADPFPAPRSLALLARLGWCRAGDPGQPGLEGDPAIVDIGPLLESYPVFPILVRDPDEGEGPIRFTEGDDEERKDPTAPFSREFLLRSLTERFRPEPGRADEPRFHLAGAALFTPERGPEPEAVRALLDETARAAARILVVDLWHGSVERADLEGPGRRGPFLDPSWVTGMGSRPGVRARCVSWNGVRAGLCTISSREYVADFEKVSGGTGFRLVVEADPVVQTAGEGLLLDVEAREVAGAPWAQLHVSARFARPPRFGHHRRVRLSHEVEVEEKGGRREAKPAGESVEVDLPEWDDDRWESSITAEIGRPVLLNALPDPAAPGRVRAVVAVVHAFALE